MPQLEKKNNVCEIQVIKYQNAEILGILKISCFRGTKDFLLNCVYQYQKEGTVGEQVSTAVRFRTGSETVHDPLPFVSCLWTYTQEHLGRLSYTHSPQGYAIACKYFSEGQR